MDVTMDVVQEQKNGFGACEMHPDGRGWACSRPIAWFGNYLQGHEDFDSDCFSTPLLKRLHFCILFCLFKFTET